MQATFSTFSEEAFGASDFATSLFAGLPPQPAISPNAAKARRAAPFFIH